MKVYLYCDARSLNDATSYYVNRVVDPLKDKGYEFLIVHSLRDIKNPDIIFTITGKYFFIAKLRYPCCKTIYWAQGVSAEEAKMSITDLKSFFRYVFRAITEPIAVRRSDVLFCVSERMVQYYTEKYGFVDKGQCVIMPCYNLQLSDSFKHSQYEKPTFVYAGGFNIWQGIDFMLSVYAQIEKSLPNCKLTILSNQKDAFDKEIKKYGIKDCEIKYVPLNLLQDELHKYKYGFIIRDNNIVNNVSTPTKMNSYLSNYVIPIYSDAVDSFVRHIELGDFKLMVNCPLDVKSAANKIIDFENTPKDYSNYEKVVRNLFEVYYNDMIYYNIMIEKYIKNLLK